MFQRNIGQSSTNRMSSRQNQFPIGQIHFPTKFVRIKTLTPHAKQQFPPVQEPQSMCTRNVTQNRHNIRKGPTTSAKTMTDMKTLH